MKNLCIYRNARLRLPLLLLLCVGCTVDVGKPTEKIGTDTGNALRLSLSVAGTGAAQSNEIEIDQAWMGLNGLTFYNCDGGVEAAAFRGPFAIDLSGDNSLGAVDTVSTSLCSVEMRFYVYAQGDRADPLSGLSLYLSGMTAQKLPFEVRSARAVTVHRDFQPIALSAGTNHMVITLDPVMWMKTVDLKNAEQVQGVVLIDETHNTADLDAIHGQMMQSMQLDCYPEMSSMMGGASGT